MRNLYCDVFLCACPSVAEGSDRFEAFLEGILFLRDLPRANWLKLCVSDDTTYALHQENRYPIRPNLEQAIAAFGGEELQAEDIIQIVDGLFKRVVALETLTGIEDCLFEDLNIIPEITLNGRGLRLEQAFDKFVLLSAHDCLTPRGCGQPFQVITREVGVQNNRVQVSGRIIHVEGTIDLALPVDVTAEAEIHQSFVSLCSCVSLSNAWLESTDEHDYVACLRMQITRSAAELGIPLATVRRWWFGRSFISSFARLPFNEDAKIRRLLKSCAEAVLRQNLGATHALRTSTGGNSSQMTRGAFKAWRRDMDYEYHLHYWDDGSGVELSAVVVHNDFSIP